MHGELTFERSTDYAAIRELLTEPSCYRRMQGAGSSGASSQEPGARIELDVGPREGVEYITAHEKGSLLAVFLLVDGEEVHFCFVPQAWGRTEPIARAFLAWAWANTTATRLLGPIPRYNRLALRLAKKVGFKERLVDCDLVLLEIRKP